MMRRAGIALALLTLAGVAHAEPAPARALTIGEAVDAALAHHPRLRAAAAEEAAAGHRIAEAEAGALPDLGVSAEINRSTSNTVPGAFAPIPGVAPIAGATRGKAFEGGTFQTGAAVWASYDVLAFSRQAAAVDLALATRNEASAVTAARRLDVAYRAADAFLLLLEADAAVRAAEAAVTRARVAATVTRGLTEQNLRPGSDLARVEAELTAAVTQVARAEQTRDVRRVALAEALGDASASVDARAEHLLDATAAPAPTAGPPTEHPELRQADANVARARQAERVVSVEYLPRVDVLAALWMRGSGIFDSPAQGLLPDTPNWIAGATLTWSALDMPQIRARARGAAAARDAASARRDEVALAVAGQMASAQAMLRGSSMVAQQTPRALAAARTAEEQASARFKTGLTPALELADAQRVLAQAEIDDAVARLEVQRALLATARASGDLGPFLRRAKTGAP